MRLCKAGCPRPQPRPVLPHCSPTALPSAPAVCCGAPSTGPSASHAFKTRLQPWPPGLLPLLPLPPFTACPALTHSSRLGRCGGGFLCPRASLPGLVTPERHLQPLWWLAARPGAPPALDGGVVSTGPNVWGAAQVSEGAGSTATTRASPCSPAGPGSIQICSPLPSRPRAPTSFGRDLPLINTEAPWRS